MDTVDALRNSSLLAALGEEQLAGLAGMARQRTFGPGDVLIRSGDSRASAMFVIVDGAVEVRSEGTVVAELGAGSAVGELALLSPDTARTADVVATEDTTVVALARWDFLPYVRGNPDVAQAVIEELVARIEAANARLSAD
jgi:CRP-like cAMP-binding protein